VASPPEVERRSAQRRLGSSPDWLKIWVAVAVIALIGVGLLMSYLPLDRHP
jgi:hypothetical protein